MGGDGDAAEFAVLGGEGFHAVVIFEMDGVLAFAKALLDFLGEVGQELLG